MANIIKTHKLTRRQFLSTAAVGSAMTLSGCDPLSSAPNLREMILSSGEWLAYRTHRLIGADSLAREYDASEMSPVFRTNGSVRPGSDVYAGYAAEQFANWQLKVDGLVAMPGNFSLTALRALPSRTQITRHDCVEGWSAVGKWTGVQLSQVLNAVKLQPSARYLVFHCADEIRGTPYYESIDLVDAFHPQTLLAYGMNDDALPIGHGAPIRLRVERQLGYKHAKYIMRIEAVSSLSSVGKGKGGFWEDLGNYEWYAGV